MQFSASVDESKAVELDKFGNVYDEEADLEALRNFKTSTGFQIPAKPGHHEGCECFECFEKIQAEHGEDCWCEVCARGKPLVAHPANCECERCIRYPTPAFDHMEDEAHVALEK